jgi:hypothetical protein
MAVTIHTDEIELTHHADAYHHFMLGVKWSALTLGVLITFFTLWFCTPAGFFGGLIAAIVVLTVGVWAMRHFLAHSTERDGPH